MTLSGATPNYTSRLELLFQLADLARKVTLPQFLTQVEATSKSDHYFDPVTPADRECEYLLREHIYKAFPDDGIHGEEFEATIGSSGWNWSIDPIDGTRGYIAGVPVWSTLIGLSYHASPVLGLMDFPALDKRYCGTPGKSWVEGADATHEPLQVKPCIGLKEAVLGCTEPLAMFSAEELRTYQSIREKVRFSRLGLDAYGYALIAEGRMDIIVEARLKPCDVSAIIPVIKNAGGHISTWSGGSAQDGGNIVACGDMRVLRDATSLLHAELKSAE